MLKHRFMPYIVGGCVLALLGVAYLSYVTSKANQNHKEWVAEMDALQHEHSSRLHIHQGEEESIAARIETTEHAGDNPAFVGMTPDGEYSYDIAGRLYISEEPMSQREIDVNKYLLTGEMTPLVEEAIRETQEIHARRFEDKVIQMVLAPDGQLYQVLVPRWETYEEGDLILKSEINNPLLKEIADSETRTPGRRIITEEGEVHSLPAEYYAIEDPHEQEKYFKKFDQSIQLGTSIAGIEQMIAAGKLDLSLTETEREIVDLEQAALERRRAFSPGTTPPLLDKPPVKVGFLPDDDDMVGWIRKHNPRTGSGEAAGTAYSGADTFSEGNIKADASGAPVRSDVPVSPSDLSDMIKPQPPQNVADIETQLTPEGIEAELNPGVSLSRFDKAQQLIDQYGTEEGLRRLREMDPEAARRFESDPDSIEDAENRHKLRSQRVGTGREQRNPPTHDTSDDAASTQ